MTEYRNSRVIRCVCIYCSILLLAAGAAGAVYTGEGMGVLESLKRILLSPSRLVTDYYGYGSLGAAFLNAGLCGTAIVLIVLLLRAEFTEMILAGYFLVIAHCFYGKNFLNIWPCAAAAALFLLIRRKGLRRNLHICMFATCFGPLISELLFRYFTPEFSYPGAAPGFAGIAAAAGAALAAGFLFPMVLPAASRISGGNNLYNAGLAGGITGAFFYLILFVLPGRPAPAAMTLENPVYESFGKSYFLFVNLFFLALFGGILAAGFCTNGKSFRGYGALLRRKDGVLLTVWGSPLCLINLGIYGLFVLGLYDLIIATGGAAGFSGPTTGGLIAAMTFSFIRQTPGGTWPVFAGYVLWSLIILLTGGGWILSTQGMLSSLAFATGLAPLVMKKGPFWGIAAGAVCAAICKLPVLLHGGLMMYNGGFTAGLTAVIMTAVLALTDFIGRDSLYKKQ